MLARDCDRDIRLYADAADGENSRLLALVRDALPLSKSSQYIVLSSHRLLVDDGSSRSADAEARRLLQGVGVDIASMAGRRSGALLWACAADGVAGVLETEQDAGLFAREAAYRAGLRTDAQTADAAIHINVAGSAEESPGSSGGAGGAILERRAQAAASALEAHGAAVLHGFLGADAAETELWAAGLGGEVGDAHTFGEGKPGAGRGDTACLPDTLPTALLARLDELVAAIGKKSTQADFNNHATAHGIDGGAARSSPPRAGQLGQRKQLEPVSCLGMSCSERLRQCRFRSWPMLATYKPGNRYTYHLDNPRGRNGRVLTVIFYLNRGWTSDDGGVLRLLRPAKGCSRSSSAENAEEMEVPSQVIAEVVPTLDTLAMFWSDCVPHEVLPPTGKFSGGSDRRAVSVWYLCPSRGAEQFTAGSPLPVSGLEMPEAAAQVLTAADMAAEASGGPRMAPEALEWLRVQASASYSGS